MSNNVKVITDLIVVDGKNAPVPSGYVKIPVDLNRDAGGDYLYLCYTTMPEVGDPIRHVLVIFGKDTETPTGYTKIDTDLNKNAGGNYIYLCYLQ